MKELIESVTHALHEISMARMSAHAGSHGDRGVALGIVSASRNDDDLNDLQQKQTDNENTGKLEEEIKKLGLGYKKTRGGYIEDKDTPEEKDVTGEKSFTIFANKGDNGELLEHLKRLGTMFNQESIIHKPEDSTTASFHYVTGKKAGTVEKVGDFRQGDKNSIYFSTLNGRKKKFVFD